MGNERGSCGQDQSSALEGKWLPQEPHIPWHVKLPCQPGVTKCSSKGWGECLLGDSVTESKLALLATGCFSC